MRGKIDPPPEVSQSSRGQARQVSQLFGEAIGDTREWVEIHRTSDEWEANLIPNHVECTTDSVPTD